MHQSVPATPSPSMRPRAPRPHSAILLTCAVRNAGDTGMRIDIGDIVDRVDGHQPVGVRRHSVYFAGGRRVSKVAPGAARDGHREKKGGEGGGRVRGREGTAGGGGGTQYSQDRGGGGHLTRRRRTIKQVFVFLSVRSVCVDVECWGEINLAV